MRAPQQLGCSLSKQGRRISRSYTPDKVSYTICTRSVVAFHGRFEAKSLPPHYWRRLNQMVLRHQKTFFSSAMSSFPPIPQFFHYLFYPLQCVEIYNPDRKGAYHRDAGAVAPQFSHYLQDMVMDACDAHMHAHTHTHTHTHRNCTAHPNHAANEVSRAMDTQHARMKQQIYSTHATQHTPHAR